MSHQRIIGLIVLGCLFLLVLPFLSSEHKLENSESNITEIIVPEVKDNNKPVQEITIEKFNTVAPATPPLAVGEKSDLIPPTIEPFPSLKPSFNKPVAKNTNNKIRKKTSKKTSKKTRKKGWYVQIASLKRSNPIAIESLKSSLRKLNVSIETENARVRKTKYVRIITKVLANKASAIKERDRINKNLAYDRIKAIVRKR